MVSLLHSLGRMSIRQVWSLRKIKIAGVDMVHMMMCITSLISNRSKPGLSCTLCQEISWISALETYHDYTTVQHPSFVPLWYGSCVKGNWHREICKEVGDYDITEPSSS